MNKTFSRHAALPLLALMMLVAGCTEQTKYVGEMSCRVVQNGYDVTNLEYDYRGGTQIVQVRSNMPWTMESDQDWCTVSNHSGSGTSENSAIVNILVTTQANTASEQRTATITFSAGGEDLAISVLQGSQVNVVRPAGMERTATQLVHQFYIGWNIGNTLEATAGETSWGNPKVTKEYVSYLKQLGVNAVRIPCAWNGYLDSGGIIDPSWLSRVKEVVDYCVDQDMYAIINIHWDDGWLQEHCGTSYMSEEEISQLEDKVGDIWTQLAETFRDYDEHLLFACCNEPDVKTANQMTILARYEQRFVDVVRASGGNNEYRCLVVQGPSTDMPLTLELMKMPNDKTPDSMILEVHFYAPWSFTKELDESAASWLEDGLATMFWGEAYRQYGSYDKDWQEDKFLSLYKQMKERFVDSGIPVIVGEFGCANRKGYPEELQQAYQESRKYYHRFIVENLKNYGMAPFLWDIGQFVSRTDGSILDDDIVSSVLEGAAAGNYPY